MMVEMMVPVMGRAGIASGDHSMNPQITSAYLDSLGIKAGISGIATDLRTYRNEFDESNLSVIGQVNLRVGKKMLVKNMTTGQQEVVDTLVSPQGRPAEYFIYEGEAQGKVYTELLDKYHTVAQSDDDITAVWVSHRDETEENTGRNVRIFKLEKQFNTEKEEFDVVLTSYTAGGSEEGGWRFMEGITGNKHDRSVSLHGTTAFFDQTVAHDKIYDTLVASLTAQEKDTAKRFLEKFQQEVAIPDDIRRVMNEKEEAAIKKEILEQPDVMTGIGIYAQALAASVELSRKAYKGQSGGGELIDQNSQIIEEKRLEDFLLLAKYRQIISATESIETSAKHLVDLLPDMLQTEKDIAENTDITIPFIPAFMYVTIQEDNLNLLAPENSILPEESVQQKESHQLYASPVINNDTHPLVFVKTDRKAQVNLKSDLTEKDSTILGQQEMMTILFSSALHETVSFFKDYFLSIDSVQRITSFLESKRMIFPPVFEITTQADIQKEMIIHFIQFITNEIIKKSDFHLRKSQKKLVDRLHILASFRKYKDYIVGVDIVMQFLFVAEVIDYIKQVKYTDAVNVSAVWEEARERFFDMCVQVLHIDIKAEYDTQHKKREAIIEALYILLAYILKFVQKYKRYQLNRKAVKEENKSYSIEKLLHLHQTVQSQFPRTGLIYAYPILPALASNRHYMTQ